MGADVTLLLRGRALDFRGDLASSVPNVFRLRRPQTNPEQNADTALIRCDKDIKDALRAGFLQAAVVGDCELIGADSQSFRSIVRLPKDCDYLNDGDVIGFEPTSRRFRTLYRRSSSHNSFLVTERCNHNCLMCSQPPKDVDDEWLLDEISQALDLVDPQTLSFAFTGGEPLTNWRRFIQLLRQSRDTLPQTAVHVLTNGRAFVSDDVVDAWASLKHPRLSAGIPVYSAIDHVHDYVVQSVGAFDETVLGILKLKDRGQRVEVRVVLHAVTAPRIFETANWLARNMPFIDHIAIMGLEHTGFALANSDLLSVDPVDYTEELEKAIRLLAASGLRVSIYNLPKCLLPTSIWSYAVQSISDWKRGFLDECELCAERPNCAGFFTTGKLQRSRGIKAISK